MTKMIAFSFVAISFLNGSCTKPFGSGQISVDSQDPEILNGKVVGTSNVISKSVVKIQFKNKNILYSCTGTLVEKNFVVTAAHCLTADDGSKYSDIEVQFISLDSTNAKPVKKVIPAKNFVIHPLYQVLKPRPYDVGLILLQSEAPADFFPAIVPMEFANLTSLTLYAAGFGQTETKDPINSDLRWAQVDLSSQSELALPKDDLFSSNANTREGQLFKISQLLQTSTGICYGDSGGPLFYLQGSKMILLGITANVTAGPTCLGVGTISSITYFRRFFADAFHQLRTLGNLDGVAKIPAWENQKALATDSQNIENWQTPTQLSLVLEFMDTPYAFKKARLISPASEEKRWYSGNDFELQISIDENFNCLSKARTSQTPPTMAIPLSNWPKEMIVESRGLFQRYLDNQFQKVTFTAHFFEISGNRAKLNIKTMNNVLASVDMDVLDCRE